jgi:hypothetical protein
MVCDVQKYSRLYLPFRGAAAFSPNIHISNLVASGMKTSQVGIGNCQMKALAGPMLHLSQGLQNTAY